MDPVFGRCRQWRCFFLDHLEGVYIGWIAQAPAGTAFCEEEHQGACHVAACPDDLEEEDDKKRGRKRRRREMLSTPGSWQHDLGFGYWNLALHGIQGMFAHLDCV